MIEQMIEHVERLPARARAARQARGIGIHKAAFEIGIGYTTLRRFEHGNDAYISTQLAVLRWLAAGQEPTP